MYSKIFRNTPLLKNVILAAFTLSLSSYYQNRLKNVNLFLIFSQKLKTIQQNCGIIGVLTLHHDAEKVCLEGIELLQNRGYDSAGFLFYKMHN